MKRKKRLEKGVESLKEEIKIHEEKREKAKAEGKVELEGYYNKEIDKLKREKEKKEDQLKRQ